MASGEEAMHIVVLPNQRFAPRSPSSIVPQGLAGHPLRNARNCQVELRAALPCQTSRASPRSLANCRAMPSPRAYKVKKSGMQ